MAVGLCVTTVGFQVFLFGFLDIWEHERNVMFNWIRNLLLRFLKLTSVHETDILINDDIQSLSSQVRKLNTRVVELEQDFKPYVFFCGKIKDFGHKVAFDWQVAESPGDNLTVYLNPMRPFTLESVKLIGSMYEIFSVSISNCEVLDGKWPAQLEWKISKELGEVNIGGRVVVRLQRRS